MNLIKTILLSCNSQATTSLTYFREVLKAMAICHEAVVESDQGRLFYNV